MRVGERVVLRRNSHDPDDRASVANGHAGTVTAMRTTEPSPSPSTTGRPSPSTSSYLQRGGHVTHAYALTTHRAQGGTWDLAIAVGADTLYREAAYVQLSRGTHANHIVLTDPEATELLNAAARDTARHDHGIAHPDDEPDPAEDHLTNRLSRSGAKHLAHTLDTDISRHRPVRPAPHLPRPRRPRPTRHLRRTPHDHQPRPHPHRPRTTPPTTRNTSPNTSPSASRSAPPTATTSAPSPPSTTQRHRHRPLHIPIQWRGRTHLQLGRPANRRTA